MNKTKRFVVLKIPKIKHSRHKVEEENGLKSLPLNYKDHGPRLEQQQRTWHKKVFITYSAWSGRGFSKHKSQNDLDMMTLKCMTRNIEV